MVVCMCKVWFEKIWFYPFMYTYLHVLCQEEKWKGGWLLVCDFHLTPGPRWRSIDHLTGFKVQEKFQPLTCPQLGMKLRTQRMKVSRRTKEKQVQFNPSTLPAPLAQVRTKQESPQSVRWVGRRQQWRSQYRHVHAHTVDREIFAIKRFSLVPRSDKNKTAKSYSMLNLIQGGVSRLPVTWQSTMSVFVLLQQWKLHNMKF